MPIKDKNVRTYIAQLIDNELFQQHIRTNVLPKTPTIKPYSVEDAKAEEHWKADSYRLEGFKLCFTHLFGVDIDQFKGD